MKKIKPVIESSGRGSIEKKKSLPEGISHKESHYSQELADNRVIQEQVKKEAREKGEIATRTEVLKQIKRESRNKLFPLICK